MRTTCLCFLTLFVLPSLARAQRLAAYDWAPATIAELQPPTPLLPGPVPPLVAYPTLPALPPPIGPALVPPGDSTFDNLAGFHYFTNGLLLAAMATPAFPPAGPLPPPIPFPPPVLAAIGGGPVTGIAINPVMGVLWVTGVPGIVVGVAPAAGMAILVPPFPLAFPTGPISGLEWDGSTGTLLACDVAGVVYTFFPGGFPAAPPVAAPMPLPGPANDVAIDKTLRLNGAGVRPIYVVAGPAVLEINAPMMMPFPSGVPAAQGLAFIDHPAANPPIGACLCPGTGFPTLFNTAPMSAGSLAYGIGLGGLPAGWPVIWVFDVAVFNPLFPLVNGVGCGLGIVPGSATTITFGGVADPLGNAVLPLPLVPPNLPLGAGPFYNQNATFCPTDPVLGLVITPMQTLYVSGF
ncbi:MAG: hypothetical protein KF830_15545 [Planctomycetes bacterium]|nr:hypothetical protein [Planctomycetota bacterium]